MLKKLLTSFFVVVFVSTLGYGYQQGVIWKTFNSPEGKFNILTPAKPTLDVKDVDSVQGTLTLYLYSCTTSNGYFLVSYGDYTTAAKDAEEADLVLDGVREGIVNGSKSELVSERKISLSGNPGREIVTKKSDLAEAIVFKWRIFLVGRRLYQLAVGTSQKDANLPDVAKFLTSFELIR